jgi:hypothetical protein
MTKQQILTLITLLKDQKIPEEEIKKILYSLKIEQKKYIGLL